MFQTQSTLNVLFMHRRSRWATPQHPRVAAELAPRCGSRHYVYGQWPGAFELIRVRVTSARCWRGTWLGRSALALGSVGTLSSGHAMSLISAVYPRAETFLLILRPDFHLNQYLIVDFLNRHRITRKLVDHHLDIVAEARQCLCAGNSFPPLLTTVAATLFAISSLVTDLFGLTFFLELVNGNRQTGRRI